MSTVFNFTKIQLGSLPCPVKGMTTYKDTKEKGLSLYVTSNGAKTFFVRKRIDGRDERIILGNYPDLTIEQARTKALRVKSQIADGKNPNLEKHQIRDEMTFGELFNEYLERYSKKNKRSWKYDEREVNKFLSKWLTRKISTISQQEIRKIHESVCEKNGLYQANRLLERIRAIFNKALEWGWNGKNPTVGIKKYRERSRDRFIQPHELPLLFDALDSEPNETARDYILMSLMTGARKANVLAMRWDQVDRHRGEWRIPYSKNGEPLTIPLISQAIELLEARRLKSNDIWVFPSDSRSGSFKDPKRAWDRIRKIATLNLWRQSPDYSDLIDKVDHFLRIKNRYVYTVSKLYNEVLSTSKRLGIMLPIGLIDIRLHDIRRTVGSYQAISGSSLQIIGKSLGHKSLQATQIYSRLNLDPVRHSMEEASKLIFISRDA